MIIDLWYKDRPEVVKLILFIKKEIMVGGD
jgi:hypothetical protein